MNDLHPIGDRVVVKLPETEETDSGILVISEDKNNKVAQVVAVGPEVRNIIPGERILFSGYSFFQTRLNGSKIGVLREEDVMAVLDDHEQH